MKNKFEEELKSKIEESHSFTKNSSESEKLFLAQMKKKIEVPSERKKSFFLSPTFAFAACLGFVLSLSLILDTQKSSQESLAHDNVEEKELFELMNELEINEEDAFLIAQQAFRKEEEFKTSLELIEELDLNDEELNILLENRV